MTSKRFCQFLYFSSILSFLTIDSTLASSDNTGVLAIKFFSLSNVSTSCLNFLYLCLLSKTKTTVTKITAIIKKVAINR